MAWPILILFSVNSFAHTVLVQAADSSRLDYQAELKAHADYQSPVQAYIEHHPGVEAREALLSIFAEAQHAFLERSGSEAKALFQSLIGQLVREDWAESDREIFLQAYLRLAQLEDQPPLRDQWLRQSLILGHDVAFDANLYPPPLIERRENLARELKSVPLLPRFLNEGWHSVLVDGRVCDHSNCPALTLASGLVRLTFLSNRWRVQTHIVDAGQIEELRVKPLNWAKGDCQRSEWAGEAEIFPKRKLFVNPDCGRPDHSLKVGVTPVLAETRDVLPQTAPSSAPSTSLLKNKWLWIGLGAVATVVVFSVANQHHESKEPTTSYGY